MRPRETLRMSTLSTSYEHVVLDENGVPTIDGTSMKVVELVLETAAYGWSPEELHFQHPYLTLGQIHSALAYYWDHKDELDQDIARRRARVEEIRRTTPISPLVSRLRAQK